MFLIGDAYILGKDIEQGVKKLTLKYGKVCGFWLGSDRAVVVADFDILQELLNKPETADRPTWPPEVIGKSNTNILIISTTTFKYLNLFASVCCKIGTFQMNILHYEITVTPFPTKFVLTIFNILQIR